MHSAKPICTTVYTRSLSFPRAVFKLVPGAVCAGYLDHFAIEALFRKSQEVCACVSGLGGCPRWALYSSLHVTHQSDVESELAVVWFILMLAYLCVCVFMWVCVCVCLCVCVEREWDQNHKTSINQCNFWRETRAAVDLNLYIYASQPSSLPVYHYWAGSNTGLPDDLLFYVCVDRCWNTVVLVCPWRWWGWCWESLWMTTPCGSLTSSPCHSQEQCV